MKRTIYILAAAVQIALFMMVIAFAYARPANSSTLSSPTGPFYDATGAREAAIVYPKDPQLNRPVYDATGAMLAAINPHVSNTGQLVRPVYDATGAMLDAIAPRSAAPVKFGPVYDATATMLDAIVLP